MRFNKIDMDSWPRREYYRHYMDTVRCTYSATVNVDITGLYRAAKAGGLKLYPVLIWRTADTVNRFEFMRYNTDSRGDVGYYDTVHPSFTAKAKERGNFNVLYCPYDKDFGRFYRQCTRIIDRYAGLPRMYPQRDLPANCFDISAIPQLAFTSFDLELYTSGSWLAPIITTGKLIKEGGKVKIPFNIKVHHRVCDGMQLAGFFEALEARGQKGEDIHL